MEIGLWIAMIAFSYLYGSINNAILISGMLKKDIRKMGSGNPGTMNMFRSFGLGWGILTLVLDALKGVIPAVLGWFLLGYGKVGYFSFDGTKLGLYACSVSVLLGHIFPVYYKFRGGKGVASTIGVCFVLNPWMSGIALVLAIVVLLTTKYGFLASFVALSLPCIYEFVSEMIAGNYLQAILILLIFGVVVLMHRTNIARFVKGVENKTIIFGKNKTSTKIQAELKEKEERQKEENKEQEIINE